MKTVFLISVLFVVAATTYMVDPDRAMAGGPATCPAFTSEMVDAAAMAYGLGPWATVGSAGDDPATPSCSGHIPTVQY